MRWAYTESTFSAALNGALLSRPVLAADVRGFFTLPLPRHVWGRTQEFRDKAFVRFVDGCLSNPREAAPS